MCHHAFLAMIQINLKDDENELIVLDFNIKMDLQEYLQTLFICCWNVKFTRPRKQNIKTTQQLFGLQEQEMQIVHCTTGVYDIT